MNANTAGQNQEPMIQLPPLPLGAVQLIQVGLGKLPLEQSLGVWGEIARTVEIQMGALQAQGEQAATTA